MQEFSSKKSHRLGKPDRKIQKNDFMGEHSTHTYAVAMDPSGKCFWDSNKVSTAYLKHLRDKQVSYIFAGKTEIDLAVAMDKLYRMFNIRSARVDGGGRVWGSFLKASLLDEVSHIVGPVAGGSIGTATLFDVEERHTKRRAKALELKSVKKMKGGVLWLRYKVKK